MAGRGRGASPCCARWSQEAGCGSRRPPPVGLHRPADGQAEPSAARSAALGTGAAVRRRPLHHHSCDHRDTYPPGQAGVRGPDRSALRPRTLADVFACAQAVDIELRLDATEIQVRRPPASRGGRRAFVSGRKKQNTMTATVIADWRGAADALDPPPRTPARHLPSHRGSRLGPHRHRLKTGHDQAEHTPLAITHQLVTSDARVVNGRWLQLARRDVAAVAASGAPARLAHAEPAPPTCSRHFALLPQREWSRVVSKAARTAGAR